MAFRLFLGDRRDVGPLCLRVSNRAVQVECERPEPQYGAGGRKAELSLALPCFSVCPAS